MTRRQSSTVVRLLHNQHVRDNDRDFVVMLDTLRDEQLNAAQANRLQRMARMFPIAKPLRGFR